MMVHPPVGKRKRYPPLSLTVIHAHERGTPAGREPIRWDLLTDLPVEDLAAAVEKLDWYALRWRLETYHKVLKSGCQAEQARLRTAERLTNLLAVLCVVGWRVFWLTMVNRATPDAPAQNVLTKPEIELLACERATLLLRLLSKIRLCRCLIGRPGQHFVACLTTPPRGVRYHHPRIALRHRLRLCGDGVSKKDGQKPATRLNPRRKNREARRRPLTLYRGRSNSGNPNMLM
jgi:hypothetical protein